MGLGSGDKAWRRDIGLVLPGGGARCAYQVGVLKAIAEMAPRGAANPFPVISGTSAGAVNGVVLATRARRFQHALTDLERVWANFQTHDVFRSDSKTMVKGALQWLTAFGSAGLLGTDPRSLLDNEPFRNLLKRHVKFTHIQDSIDRGHLDAIAITAAGYGSARSISFFQGKEGLETWTRVRRRGQRTDITLDHVMASIAAPLIFPPVLMGREYFGDGAMRQATPLSPAVRLGAKRLLVIGVRNEEQDPEPAPDQVIPHPSLGRIAGYMLDALLMDGLSSDLERLMRINEIVNEQPGRKLHGDVANLKAIDALIIYPSQDVREIALRYVDEMPMSVRILMRMLGAMNYGGRQLVSYLLFESGYTQALIKLGYDDAVRRREELLNFMRGVPLGVSSGIVGWRDLSEEYSQRLPALRLDENNGSSAV
jgi:NTE family protein